VSGTEGRPLKIVHVIHAIPPHVGGPAVTVPALCEALAALGHDVSLHTTDHGGAPATPKGVKLHVHRCLPGGGRLGISPSMSKALREEAEGADIVHSHGLWLWTNLDVHWATRHKRCKVVISPRGMLEPYSLQRSAFRKRVMWHLGQGAALRAADLIHVTAESELQSVRALGLANPVAVVPNGVTIPEHVERRRGERRTLLFLGRIDHKKGVDLLLEAWAQVAHDFPDWDIVIAGPAAGDYESKMRALAARLQAPRVSFIGPRYGAERDALLASAELFVLPTRSENFGMTVAEALAAGVPVICTKGAPWQGLEEHGCGFWVECESDALRDGLRRALSLPRDVLASYGATGGRWMAQDFGWCARGKSLTHAYEHALTQRIVYATRDSSDPALVDVVPTTPLVPPRKGTAP
jgi:glycosyltransferase involved in cell wall biosynthesis